MKGRWHLRHVIWLLAVLTTASTLLLLVLSPSTEQRLPFRLAIGPQLATQHGLSGDPAKGGASAYLDAVQALSGVKLELVRAPSIERAVQMLQDKQVDGVAFSLPSTAETLPPSIILSPSFYSGHTVLVTRRSARAQTLKAMNGMRVGVIANGEYRAFLAQSFPSIDAYQMANVDEMLDAVDRGAIDAALGVDAVLAPMSRKRFGDRLLVRVVPDVPPVEIRVASLPHRAAEIEMAYQAYSSLPLAARQDILDRWLDAFYRSPPTLRAMLYHYRLYAVLFCLALLTFLLTVARGRRRARELASRQASAARILTLVNHEMRNGAASVISAIDLLEMENDANERDRLLRSARAAADALKHTLTNALEFMFRNRPDGADSTFLKNASEVVEECLWATRPLAHYKGLRLTMDIDDARSHHALCDARALHHITSNLLSNAIKFSDQGDVAITLRFVAGVGNAGSLTLSVTDAGPGIAQEDIARIFEPLSATRIGRLKHGAGIGLSLCRQIARAHGGDITVFSELGKGATFFAVLRAEAGADLKTVGSQPHINHPLSSNRALVIEDQSAIARIIARRLHHLGFDAHVASSGEEARIAMTELGPFRIITIDNDLLDANGSDIALDIRSVERRQDWPQARLLSVSASSDTIDRSGYVRAGVEIFMDKPIDWAAFDATCGRAEPGSSNQHAVPEQELALMDVYERQMLTDRAALEESLRAENWRGALAMVHRMQGAAAMVADDEVVATLCALQESLKSHAINGTPADGRIWALLDTLSRRE